MIHLLIYILVLLSIQNPHEKIEKLDIDLEIHCQEKYLFSTICDIATDSINRIYVLDLEEKCVYLFDENGNYIMKIGREGVGPGEFSRPCSLFIDPLDFIYVYDAGNFRIEVFQKNGKLKRSIKLTKFPAGGMNRIFVDKEGNIYLSGCYYLENSSLCKYSPEGEFVEPMAFPIIEYDGIQMNDHEKRSVAQYLAGGSMYIDEKSNITFSYQWPKKIDMAINNSTAIKNVSIDKTWIPAIFRIEPSGIFYGNSTVSKKIFKYRNKLINSIYFTDWEGNIKKKIPLSAIMSHDIHRYFIVKDKYTILELFSEEGILLSSKKINEDIIVLNSDNKHRILGFKIDKEGFPVILRFRIENDLI